jgi:hypothetical protein
MLHHIAAAAVLALTAASPALAQGKGDGGGDKARGNDHAGMDHGTNKGGKKGTDRGAKSDPVKSVQRETAKVIEGIPRRGGVERVGDIRDQRTRVIERAVVRETDRDDDRRRTGWDGDGDWDGRGRSYASVPACPPGLAKKNNGCLPPGIARQERDLAFDFEYRPTLFGIPLRTRADYVYYDGYLVPANSSGLSYIPLLGGALAAGRVWPQTYPSLSLADWQHDYYGFDDPRGYRYADNVVYQIDPETAAIQAVVALLTGNDFAVGQPMPLGYDVYNVPGPYQERYPDSDDALYRYADGRVYEVDPTTMLIAKAIDLVT